MFGLLNLGIDGSGYFVLQEDGGTLVFSRDGSFGLDRSGYFVNARGLRTQPPFSVPPDASRIHVATDGTIDCTFADGARRRVGAIQLATFRKPEGLQGLGLGLLAETLASGPPRIGPPGAHGAGPLRPGHSAGTPARHRETEPAMAPFAVAATLA